MADGLSHTRKVDLTTIAGQITGTHTNFLILFTEANLPSEMFDADGSSPAQNGGGDIRFTSDAAGTVDIACEVVSFVTDNDPANGTAEIWVEAPNVRSSQTDTIYCFYNTPGSDSQPAVTAGNGRNAVWNLFAAIWHCSGTVDSTGNGNTLTENNAPSIVTTGITSGAYDLNGTTQYLSAADSADLDIANNFTMSIWVKPDNNSGVQADSGLIDKTAGNNDAYKLILTDGGDTWRIRDPDLSGANLNDVDIFTAGDDIFLASTFDDTTRRLFKDGAQTASDTPTGTISTNIDSLFIGQDQAFSAFWAGLVDEVRIASADLGANWLATDENNIRTPGSFITVGTPTAVTNTLVLNNVQTGTIAFGAANTSRNVTITSVDTSKCFILIDWQTDSAGSVATTQHYRARLSSSTNIAIDRTAAVSGDDGIVRWWAIEFSAGITVRHFTGTSRNTNVAIGATVDLAKTFAIISDRPQTFDYDDSQIEAVDIVSTTNFQVKTDNTAESAPNWAVQIIEFDALADPVVEAVTITMSGGTTTNTGSISAVTVADSMLIGSGTWSETLGVANQMGFSAALDDTTTVSVTRVTGTGTLIAYMFVIDWGASIDIRTGVDTLTTVEGVSETQTFSALGSTGDAIAFMRGGSGTFGAQSNHSGSPDDADYAEVSLDSTTQITITRSGTSNDLGPYNWQVIDFAGFAAEDVLMPQVWM